MQAKKIMFTLLGIFMAAMIQAPTIYSVEKWFPVVIGIVALFWAFDSYTYFYQEKLRAAMDVRFEAIKQRYTDTENNDECIYRESKKRSTVYYLDEMIR